MTDEVKRGSYKPLWFLIALCAFPYVAGTLYYQYRDVLPATGTNNYGSLIQPVLELPPINLERSDGGALSMADYRKKWLMMYVAEGSCDELCTKNIYYIRQIRKAMAEDRFRINRLLVLDDKSLLTEELKQTLNEFEGMDVATVMPESRASFDSTLKGISGSIFGKIIIVDPLGNFMMEYGADPEPKKLLKDIKQLLKVSRIG